MASVADGVVTAGEVLSAACDAIVVPTGAVVTAIVSLGLNLDVFVVLQEETSRVP